MTLTLPILVTKILQDLEKNNFQGYVVGGAVRDLIMDRPTYDWDFTTNATPAQILEIFPDGFYDNTFGTVGIAIKDLVKKYDLKNIDIGRPIEITTFRSEKGYSDNRHPDKVEWGKTLEEDLQRRDFTINAIALAHNKIIDPFGGQKDIKNKIIRTVGDPNTRFGEDALRMMRAIRIASELGFTIDSQTLSAINSNASSLKKISIERIRDEFLKILKSNFPSQGVELLHNSNLLEFILPELINTQGVEQAGHHTEDVWHHSISSLKNCASKNCIVRLACLIHDLGKPIAFRNKSGKITFYGHEVVGAKLAQKISERLKLSKKDSEKLLTLVRFHMFSYNPEMTDASIRRFIKKVGLENVNDIITLRIADRLGSGSKATSWRLREFQERIGSVLYTPMQIKDLKVDGKDIMKLLKIKPGPKIGKILEKLFAEVMEDASKNNREYLLKQIEKLSKD